MRAVLFEQEINSIFGIMPVSDYILPSTELKTDKYSEDVDILLLYSTFYFNIPKSVSEIIEFIEQKTLYPADITTLSFEKEKKMGFIDKLDKKYICIK